VLLTEIAPKGKRGRSAALVYVGASAGTALGAVIWILVQLLPPDQVESYGWRLVFFSSVIVTIAAYILRMRLKDAPVFRKVAAEKEKAKATPIRDVFRYGRRGLFRTFFLNIGGNTQSYIVQVFLGSYLIETIGTDETLVPQVLLVGALAGCASAWIAGRLTDSLGRKPVIIAIAAFLVLFPAPAFMLLETRSVPVIYLVIVLGFVFAAYGTVGAQAATFPELFGSRYRYAGVALGREFSAVFGGGFAPLISGALVNWLAGWGGVAIYMMLLMSLSLITAIRMPETKDRDLSLSEDA
jgi:MFS family permease